MRRRWLPVLGVVLTLSAVGLSRVGRTPVAAQVPEPVPLPAGCSNQTLTWSPGTPVRTVADSVSPQGALISIFRLEPAAGRFIGFAPGAPDFANDYTTVMTSLETVFFCMRTTGMFARPGGTPPTPTPTPVAAPSPPARTCHPSYPSVCIPPPPPDLDCADVGVRRFTVLPPDPHRFDADRDGIGCE